MTKSKSFILAIPRKTTGGEVEMAEYELTPQDISKINPEAHAESWADDCFYFQLLREQRKKFWNYLNEPCTEHPRTMSDFRALYV